MVGIYKITNPEGKIYIGQSWEIEERQKRYGRPSVNKNQKKIYNSIKKYKWENHLFEIIHELTNDIAQNILDKYEVLYWDLYKSCGVEMLNIREPGRGGRNSEETRALMKLNNWNAKHKGELSPHYGKKHTLEHIDKSHPKGEKNAMYGRFGKDHPRYGHPQSQEWRLARCTKVIDIETLEEYESVRKAAEAFKIDETTLCKILKGKYFFKIKPNPPLQYFSEYNKQNK